MLMLRKLLLFLLVATLAACREAAIETPATTVEATPAVLPQEPAATTVTTAPAPAIVTLAPTNTVEGRDLPSPSLFDLNWDERNVFKQGLITAEQHVLEQLRGVSVYHLDIAIQEDLVTVEGQQEIHYTNNEDDPLPEVYFHLFPNLLGGAVQIGPVYVNAEPVEPVYESVNDSVMRVPLAAPLAQGEQVVFQMAFTVTVPEESGRNYGMFAYVDDILALAHFYPHIAVYDEKGWNIEPPAEYGDVVYADTSFYLVRVTAPATQVVVAGGIEIEREVDEEMQTLTFAAGPMRDFYLASSRRYIGVSQVIGETRINSYAPDELVDGAEAALSYAADALATYSHRFGIYPFTELDIVSTPTLALGIEYPGIIANTIRLYDLEEARFGASNELVLESTTAHEVAHQWFYSVIGNDQLNEPWLDESLTQYATWLYFRDNHGQPGAQRYQQSLEGRWSRVEQAEIPIGLPVSAYQDYEYGAIVYGRGPLFVQTLAQTMGEGAFANFLQDYYDTYQWDIATTQGFKELAQYHCACDLSRLFEKWVYEQ